MRFSWLQDYQELDDHLLYLKWNLNRSKRELSRWRGGDLSKIRLEKNSRASSLEESIEALESEISTLEHQKDELLLMIDSFSGIENKILRLKYIENYTLEEISDEIGYSSSYVRSKHAEIKRTLSFLENYEERVKKRNEETEELEFYDPNFSSTNVR